MLLAPGTILFSVSSRYYTDFLISTPAVIILDDQLPPVGKQTSDYPGRQWYPHIGKDELLLWKSEHNLEFQ